MATATQPLAGCSCARVRRLARRVTQLYDRALAPAGLKVTQFSLLAQLRQHGPLAIGPLAARLDMDRTTLTRNLRPLIAAGLVALERASSDARSREVQLTADGRSALGQAKALWRRAENDFVRTIGEGRAADLHRLVDALMVDLNGRTA